MTEITVYSQFPQKVEPNAELDLNPSNWKWQKCLVFPVSKLNDLQFSLRPYKWIRYCTGVVVGARGELSTERDSPNPVTMDYDSGISGVSINIDLYYHTADQEKWRMFPIDGKIVGPRTVTSSRTSTRRDEFFEDVVVRDERCVVTGDSEYCDAAHLLPHSKGDKYIETFSTHRRRDSSGDDDIVRDINDVRNGLFLNTLLHHMLGQDLAFLRTPNFAMDTTDVDSNADGAQERFTSHFFSRSLPLVAGVFGSAVRVPSDRSIWPPSILFDAVYARAVVRHFGSPITDYLKKWGDVFYPGGPTEVAHTDAKRRRDQADVDNENPNEQNAAQRQHHEKRRRRLGKHDDDDIDYFDLSMMCRFVAMEPEDVSAYLTRCEETQAAGERKALEEKVISWKESLAPVDSDNID